MKFDIRSSVLLGIVGIGVLTFSNCKLNEGGTPNSGKTSTDTSITSSSASDLSMDSVVENNDWIAAWAITAHQSDNYAKLLTKAHELSLITGWPIDSLGRSYSPELNEIVEIDSNSVRLGLYTPRREFGKWISLEQKEFFQTHGTGKSFPGTAGMAIVLSLHKNQQEAKQTLDWLKNTKSIHHVQIQAINVYTGCLN